MLFKRPSLALLLYLASVVSTTPVEAQGPASALVLEQRDPAPKTNVTALDGPAKPIVLLSIAEKCAIISTGIAAIQTVSSIGNFIASVLKAQSDYHQCAVVSGYINGVSYQYSASGRNCDTTSEQKTFVDAVDRALNFMNSKNVNQACFQLTHGGTYKGLLQIAANNLQIINGKCNSVSYNINI